MAEPGRCCAPAGWSARLSQYHAVSVPHSCIWAPMSMGGRPSRLKVAWHRLAGPPRHGQSRRHGHVDDSRRQLCSWVGKGRSPVKPLLQARNDLKPGAWAAHSKWSPLFRVRTYRLFPGPPMATHGPISTRFLPSEPIKTLESVRLTQMSWLPAA